MIGVGVFLHRVFADMQDMTLMTTILLDIS